MTTGQYLSTIVVGIAKALSECGHEHLRDAALHRALYDARDAPDAPQAIRELRFDWDGPSPRCQAIDELLNNLRIIHGQRCSDISATAHATPYARSLATAYLRQAS